jgi:tight adherence protein B
MSAPVRRAATGIAVAIVAVALALGSAGESRAQDSSTLSIESVSGREVTSVMKLDPSIAVAPTSVVRGTIEVEGVVVPAATTLNVAEEPPKVAVLALDASGSMSGKKMADARNAATGFVKAMPADVKVGLVTFSDSVNQLAKPTLDRKKVLAAIESTKTGGFTSLYDGILTAIDSLPGGERARVLVLSDGKDTVSTGTLDQVVEALSTSGAAADVVALKPSDEMLPVLNKIAAASGGSLRRAAESGALVDAFAMASGSFGSMVMLVATLPDSVDASGKAILATVSVDGVIAEAETNLPPMPPPVVQPTANLEATVIAAGSSEAPGRSVFLPLLLAALAILGVLYVSVVWIQRSYHARDLARATQVLQYETASTMPSDRARSRTQESMWLAPIDAFLAKHTNVRKVQAALAAAEFPLSPGGWLVLRLGAGAVLAILLTVAFNSLLLGVTAGFLIAWLLARTVLRSRSARRQRAFANELSDSLMILAGGIRAGLSFTQALGSIAENANGEVGRQMRRVLGEVNVGVSLDDALMDCATRMDSDDLRWMVMALAIQREVGGNLSTILDGVAATIKGRDELRREVSMLSAEGRLSGYILIGLPVGVFVFLLVVRTAYVSVLWTTPLGLLMLGGFLLAMVVGWFWMRAVVRIKV